MAALEYRKQGASFRLIAAKLGISHQQAVRDVQRELQRINDECKESAAELQRLEQERLDSAMLPIAPQVARGDLYAIDRWIAISESRRRLLGLNAPVKNALTSPDGTEPYQPFLPSREKLARLSDEELRQYEGLLAKMAGDMEAMEDEEAE